MKSECGTAQLSAFTLCRLVKHAVIQRGDSIGHSLYGDLVESGAATVDRAIEVVVSSVVQ